MSSHIIIKTYSHYEPANRDWATLAQAGIRADVQQSNHAALRPNLQQVLDGVRLMVDEADYERACQILRIKTEEAGDAALQEKRTCPECGSEGLKQQPSIILAVVFILLFFLPLATPAKKFRCTKCGHVWKV